jgi:hypothetical protein
MILNRYELDFEKSLNYFAWQMKMGNSLSLELIKELNFYTGQFFTLLPENADLAILYNFLEGGILPQNPTYVQTDKMGKKLGSYTWIPTATKEIAEFIYKKMKKNKNMTCIFEDVERLLGDHRFERELSEM